LQALRTRAKTERQIFKTGTGILEVLDLDSWFYYYLCNGCSEIKTMTIFEAHLCCLYFIKKFELFIAAHFH
jgi:hypothetical protein